MTPAELEWWWRERDERYAHRSIGPLNRPTPVTPEEAQSIRAYRMREAAQLADGAARSRLIGQAARWDPPTVLRR